MAIAQGSSERNISAVVSRKLGWNVVGLISRSYKRAPLCGSVRSRQEAQPRNMGRRMQTCRVSTRGNVFATLTWLVWLGLSPKRTIRGKVVKELGAGMAALQQASSVYAHLKATGAYQRPATQTPNFLERQIRR